MNSINLRRIARGTVFIGAAQLTARGLALVSQIFLGWLLIPEDFAFFAATFAVAALILPIAEGGVGKLLIQRGSEYSQIVGPMLLLSVLSTVVAIALMYLCLSLIDWFENDNSSPRILAFVLFGIGVASISVVFKAKLAVQAKFATIARVSIASATIQHLSVIAFAYLGFGGQSLAISFTLTKLFELLVFWLLVPSLELEKSLWDSSIFISAVLNLRWLIISAIAIVVILHGESLVLSLLLPASLGIYYFASQLSVAAVSPLTTSLQQVLLPAFSSMANDAERVSGAYRRALIALHSVAVPLCIVAILISNAAIHLVWQGKWDDAITLTQIMLITSMIRCANPIGRSVLEAAGRWQAQSMILCVDAIGTLLVVALFVPQGVIAIAMAVCFWRFVIASTQSVVVSRLLRIPATNVLFLNLGLPMLGLLCGFFAERLSVMIYSTPFQLLRAAMASAIFACTFASVLYVFFGKDLSYVWSALIGKDTRNAD